MWESTLSLFTPAIHSCIFPFQSHLFSYFFKFSSYPYHLSIHSFIYSNTSLIHFINSVTNLLIHFPDCSFIQTLLSYTKSIHSYHSFIHTIHSFKPFSHAYHPFIHAFILVILSIHSHHSFICIICSWYQSGHSLLLSDEPSSEQLGDAWYLILSCSSLPLALSSMAKMEQWSHGNEILSGHPDWPSKKVPCQRSELLRWDSGSGGCFGGLTLQLSFPNISQSCQSR